MKPYLKEDKLYVKTSELHNWTLNPRTTEKLDFERLVEYLRKRGQTVPLQVNTGKFYGKEGDLIGGNTRFKAMSEVLKFKEIWINRRDPVDLKDFIQMAMEDNDNFSRYQPDLLVELLNPYKDDPDFAKFKVPMAPSVSVVSLQNAYYPPEDGQSEGEIDPQNRLDPNKYNTAMIKQIVLYFVSQDYESIVKKIDELKSTEEYKKNPAQFAYYERVLQRVDKIKNEAMPDNTAVFLYLLEFYEKSNRNKKKT